MWSGGPNPLTSAQGSWKPSADAALIILGFQWAEVSGGATSPFRPLSFLCWTLSARGPVFPPGVLRNLSPSQLLLGLPLHLHLALDPGGARGGVWT